MQKPPQNDFETLQYIDFIEINGSGGGTRTPDTRIMIPPFNQLSYSAPIGPHCLPNARV